MQLATQAVFDMPENALHWERILAVVQLSRELDHLEESKLLPEKKVLYQFSARGHDVPQAILGSLLTHPRDALGAYYRSRPLLLSLGLSAEDALASSMALSGGFSDGRDIGVVCNLPSTGQATVLPMAGDVGSQFTPTMGWAQAITYRKDILNETQFQRAIAVAHCGEAATATNGFWSALNIATTLRLPALFYVEDNNYGISVPSRLQTPGGNIAANLASFTNLKIFDGNGSDPESSASLIVEAVNYVRDGNGPALLRLQVPRLSGHSGQDTQSYKSPEEISREEASDPLSALEHFLVPKQLPASKWSEISENAKREVEKALAAASARAEPEIGDVKRFVFSEHGSDGAPIVQRVGGMLAEGEAPLATSFEPKPQGPRINMLTAIRRVLETELRENQRVLVFGEDVGPKGGVHAATLGLQESFGEQRVFDTSLSEEGIIGRAVGMALAGLVPVAEIQFRKYADPATEQLNNCGTIRWRTANHFAAPIVVRMPGGFAKCGDPWHSVCGESQWTHAVGWQVAFPSNAEDAVGLLRSALRSNNPTIFFEHRAMLDAPWARRPYPGDEFAVPFGQARRIREGSEISVISWGAMVERCDEAAGRSGRSVDLIDLRSLVPWDREAVIESVSRTRRCLIVHEDCRNSGFGAEIAAVVAKDCFFSLDAPIERLAVDDVPIPYSVTLMDAVIPSVTNIESAITSLIDI